MIQRMNCVQNQIITHDTYLIRDKVAAFIITGGQDNVQHVLVSSCHSGHSLVLFLENFPL